VPNLAASATLHVANDQFSNTLSGGICELLIYRHALNAADRTAMSDYLANKYGLPLEPVLRGDVDCSGSVTFDDIDPFVQALNGSGGDYSVWPACNWLNGEINCDGAVTFDDIDPFVACLGGACECP
jgi:hypothetical protein